MVNGGVAAFGPKEEVLRKVLRPNVVAVPNVMRGRGPHRESGGVPRRDAAKIR